MQHNVFIRNYLTPFMQHYSDMGIYLIMHDLNGTIRFINEKTSMLIANITPDMMIGKTTYELGIIDESEHSQLQLIRQRAATQRMIIKFVNFSTNSMHAQHHNLFRPVYICTVIPVINLTNEVIATITTGYEKSFNLYRHIKGLNPYSCTHKKDLLNHLSPREFEVLYLLAHGMSQRDVATFLGISRGNVSRIITDNISRKLDVEPTTEAITAKALECDISNLIPKRLTEHKIFILNESGSLSSASQ